jgi:hypothetical protein
LAVGSPSHGRSNPFEILHSIANRSQTKCPTAEASVAACR